MLLTMQQNIVPCTGFINLEQVFVMCALRLLAIQNVYCLQQKCNMCTLFIPYREDEDLRERTVSLNKELSSVFLT